MRRGSGGVVERLTSGSVFASARTQCVLKFNRRGESRRAAKVKDGSTRNTNLSRPTIFQRWPLPERQLLFTYPLVIETGFARNYNCEGGNGMWSELLKGLTLDSPASIISRVINVSTTSPLSSVPTRRTLRKSVSSRDRLTLVFLIP
jgi:hypothetical protein